MTKTTKFNRDAVTNEDIRSLQIDAGVHGDSALVADCDRALEGDCDAAERCAKVLAKARQNAQ